MRRRSISVILALLIVVPSTGITLARFTDAAVARGALTTDTLNAPTAVTAAGGAQVTLTWTPTVDAYASGYNVYRATASGGPYSLIATVTPRSATGTTDGPGNGTFWYRIRATYQNWESVDSGTVSAISGTTNFIPCTTTAADTSGAGDNNGYETNPARACVDDSSFATDSSSGTSTATTCGSGATPSTTKDRHRFWGFALGLPGVVTSINGIRVRADIALDSGSGTSNLCAQLSWDAGVTWTTIKTAAVTGAAETTLIFGSNSDLWGRTWTLALLSTTTFRVRIIDASSLAAKQFQLDYLAVSVTYTP